MIPLFVYSYFEYADYPQCYIAAGIYLLAWVTDALDGYLARRNNWITDAGKILDPLADKLMQIAAAVCFTIDNTIFLALLIPIVLKELAIMIGGILIIKRQKVVTQAKWYGKLATVILFLCAFLRIIIRGNAVLDIIICTVMVAMILFALVMYYLKVYKAKQ